MTHKPRRTASERIQHAVHIRSNAFAIVAVFNDQQVSDAPKFGRVLFFPPLPLAPSDSIWVAAKAKRKLGCQIRQIVCAAGGGRARTEDGCKLCGIYGIADALAAGSAAGLTLQYKN